MANENVNMIVGKTGVFGERKIEEPSSLCNLRPDAFLSFLGVAPFRSGQMAKNNLHGFTILELLVASAVFSLILIMLLSLTDITSRTWKETTEKMHSFEEARSAFDRITANVAQATLNTYWDYDSPVAPTLYERRSELQFLCLPMTNMGAGFHEPIFPTHGIFFQAPSGAVADKSTLDDLPQLLNAFGYFVEYGSDAAERPGFLPPSVSPRHRYRLKEWKPASESFSLYANTSGTNGRTYLGSQTFNWLTLNSPIARTVAENVIALIVNPRNPEVPSSAPVPLTTDFIYNSRNNGLNALDKSQRHQLPPEVEIIMVAIDETSAVRSLSNSTNSPDLTAGLFHDPEKIEDDLKNLTNSLTAKNLRHIVLRSTVKIRAARWSQD